MTITLINLNDPCARVIFTWAEDMKECSFTATGDHDIDAIIAVKGHQGVDVAGYLTEVKW